MMGLSTYLLGNGVHPAVVQALGANIMLTYQDCVELSDLTE